MLLKPVSVIVFSEAALLFKSIVHEVGDPWIILLDDVSNGLSDQTGVLQM